MMGRTPAWMVGLLGALIVLVSTFLLSFRVTDTQATLDRHVDTIESRWGNHQLGDLREAHAEQLFGLALLATSSDSRTFLLDEANNSLRAAILAMDIAANNTMDEASVRNLDYQTLKNILNDLRLESMVAINQVAEMKRRVENQIDRIRLWAVALNILGLAIVMMKDLPGWKVNRHHDR